MLGMKGKLKLVTLLLTAGIIVGGFLTTCENVTYDELKSGSTIMQNSNDNGNNSNGPAAWEPTIVIPMLTTEGAFATLSFMPVTTPASAMGSFTFGSSETETYKYRLYVDGEIFSKGTVMVTNNGVTFNFTSDNDNTFSATISDNIFKFSGGYIPAEIWGDDPLTFEPASVPDANENAIPATSISLDKYTLALDADDHPTDTLTATIHGEGADTQVRWFTDKPALLQIVQNGLSATITALGGGTATVKVKTLIGGVSAECVVDITMPAIPGLFLEDGEDEAEIDLTGASGATLLAKALTWLNANVGTEDYPNGHSVTYRITLDTNESGTFAYTISKNITVKLTSVNGEEVVIEKTGTTGGLFTIAGTNCEPELVLGEKITLKGLATNNSALVVVGTNTATNKGKLTMLDGSKITGNTNTSTVLGGGVYVNTSGTFYMRGGDICENKVTCNAGQGGGVRNLGVFQMSGGNITNNAVEANVAYGGGVSITKSFTMTGGTISGNRCVGNAITTGGGGVFVYGETFTMSGSALIKDNTSPRGGGVGIDAYAGCVFTMKGGVIEGNRASSAGAAVWKGVQGTFTKIADTNGSSGIIYGTTNAEDSSVNKGTEGSSGVRAMQMGTSYWRDATAGTDITLNGAVNSGWGE
jgi:hypothetical protein